MVRRLITALISVGKPTRAPSHLTGINETGMKSLSERLYRCIDGRRSVSRLALTIPDSCADVSPTTSRVTPTASGDRYPLRVISRTAYDVDRHFRMESAALTSLLAMRLVMATVGEVSQVDLFGPGRKST